MTKLPSNIGREIMKFRLLLVLAGLAIGFSAQARAQEQNTVDPQVRQQIEALNQKFDEAFNQNDAEAVADLFTAGAIEAGPDEAALPASKRSRIGTKFCSNPIPTATPTSLIRCTQSATVSVRSRNGA
jgi:hypothetical protein